MSKNGPEAWDAADWQAFESRAANQLHLTVQRLAQILAGDPGLPEIDMAASDEVRSLMRFSDLPEDVVDRALLREVMLSWAQATFATA